MIQSSTPATLPRRTSVFDGSRDRSQQRSPRRARFSISSVSEPAAVILSPAFATPTLERVQDRRMVVCGTSELGDASRNRLVEVVLVRAVRADRSQHETPREAAYTPKRDGVRAPTPRYARAAARAAATRLSGAPSAGSRGRAASGARGLATSGLRSSKT
jgi:hypothetical protein